MEAIPSHLLPGMTYTFRIPALPGPRRLDAVLAEYIPVYSRSFFQQLIERGAVSVAGQADVKPATKIRGDLLITLVIPPARDRVEAVARPLHAPEVVVIHEHPHFVILSKSAGLSVHPASAATVEYTLVDWIREHLPQHRRPQTDTDRPGIIHRLDKDTSGLIVIATDPSADAALMKLFQMRAVQKTYHAIVVGHPPASGVITTRIMRDPLHRVRMAPCAIGGRDAYTEYRVVQWFKDHALLELKPKTGRTHQIRVHCASIGHPILGDAVYGTKAPALIGRQALHASALAFEYGGVAYEFRTDFPADFETAIRRLELLSETE